METTPKDVYQKFVELEERAAAIYLEFASHFSKDSSLSSFWLDMAMQEKQHAGLLQFCIQDKLFATDLPTSAEVQKLIGMFNRLEKDAAEPNLTVEGAFGLAIALETSEINMIYCYLTTTLHTSMYLLRHKIKTLLPNHVDDLVAAARKFGVDEKSIQELARTNAQCAARWQSAP